MGIRGNRAGRRGNGRGRGKRERDIRIRARPSGEIDPRSAGDPSPPAATATRRSPVSRKWREDATHPRALVITDAVAPASIRLVLSPIIPGRKPPKSHSNTHRGPARNTRPARAPMSEKRRARSFGLTAPRTPLETGRFATAFRHSTDSRLTERARPIARRIRMYTR